MSKRTAAPRGRKPVEEIETPQDTIETKAASEEKPEAETVSETNAGQASEAANAVREDALSDAHDATFVLTEPLGAFEAGTLVKVSTRKEAAKIFDKARQAHVLDVSLWGRPLVPFADLGI